MDTTSHIIKKYWEEHPEEYQKFEKWYLLRYKEKGLQEIEVHIYGITKGKPQQYILQNREEPETSPEETKEERN